MKKITPSKSAKKNGKGYGPLPDEMTVAVAQAVLEDVVLEATADVAALAATLEVAAPLVSDDLVIATIVPETPEEEEILELTHVPFLGPARARALADAGIRTLVDLHAATPAQIGGVKGVGLRNAERIKEWLAGQTVVDPGPPPPPPVFEMPFPPTDPVSPVGPDPVLASANQDIFDGLGELDAGIARLRETIAAKRLSKDLSRQFDKVSTVASDLAEGPDTLSEKTVHQAVKTLKKIVSLLDKAAAGKPLSDKKQDALAEALREQRKTLQKQIGA